MQSGYLFDPNIGDIQLSTAVENVFATGNIWVVDEVKGSDTNPGSATSPFATLGAAIAAATADNGDTIILRGTVHLTSTLLWNKDGVNLFGQRSPSNNCRSRISSTGATAFSPLVNVTAQGCSFASVATFHGGFTGATGSQVCWAEAGGRNYYQCVQFLGGGDATTAALAGMRSLTVAGNGENLFQGCTIGLDTITRATNANASLEFLSGTARNVFRNCLFQALVSDASDVHVLIGADGIDRHVLFDNCTFSNAINSGATPMTNAFSVNASAGGFVIVQGGLCVGAGSTSLAASGAIYTNLPAGNAAGAIGVAAT